MENDNNNLKQIEMPGFEAPASLPDDRPKDVAFVSKEEFSGKTYQSISEMIRDIQVTRNYTKSKDEPEPYQVKMIDRDTWIEVHNKAEGQAVALFLFLGDEQGLTVAETQALSSTLFSSSKNGRKASLEEVGAYLRGRQTEKVANRMLSYEDIERGIDYCQNQRNNLAIKGIVQQDRGIELPEYLNN